MFKYQKLDFSKAITFLNKSRTWAITQRMIPKSVPFCQTGTAQPSGETRKNDKKP